MTTRYKAKWKSNNTYSAARNTPAAAGALAYADRLAIDYISCAEAHAANPTAPEVAWTVYQDSTATIMRGRQYNDVSKMFSDPNCTPSRITEGALQQYGTVQQTA